MPLLSARSAVILATLKRATTSFAAAGEQKHNVCKQFATTVTRQRRDCDLNPGLLRLSSARQQSATEPQNRYKCPINATTKATRKTSRAAS